MARGGDGSPRIENELHVAAPPEQVWAFISDFKRYPEWIPVTERVVEHPDRPGPGRVYKEQGQLGPFRPRSTWTIRVHDPPVRMVHDGRMAIARFHLDISLTPEGSGTRVRHVVEFKALPWLRPVGILMERVVIRKQMQKDMRATVENLKRIVEQET